MKCTHRASRDGAQVTTRRVTGTLKISAQANQGFWANTAHLSDHADKKLLCNGNSLFLPYALS